MPLGLDPLVSYNFFVMIDGITVAQFKECDGLSIQVKVIEHRAQQLKGQPLMKKLPGSIVYEDIVLKRGKVSDQAFWTWIKQVQDGGIDAARKTGTIVLYDFMRASAT